MAEKSKGISLPLMMLLGLGFGILFGLVIDAKFAAEYVKPFGDLFITLIRMVVVPLVLCTIIAGTAGISDMTKLGRVATKTLVYYFLTTGVAILIGLAFALIVQPGVGLDLSTENLVAKKVVAPSMMKTLMAIVPLNPIDAMTKGAMLQVIFFAVLFGFGISTLGERGKPLFNFFDLCGHVMIKLTQLVMYYAPVGVFCLMAFTVSKHGLAVLMPLIKFIVIMYVAAFVHVCVVYIPCVKAAGLKVVEFFKGIFEPALIAFSTTSSAAALASNMLCTRKLGASRVVSGFSLPLGNTINMDGTAIYMGIAAVFAAGVYGIDLTASDYITIIIMGILASIGTAGVPGAGVIMVSIVFVQINVPLEAVALIAGIDRIVDMARTTLNVMGDATGAVLITKLEDGQLGLDPADED